MIGNRLPQNVQTSHAYLVSLEALSGLLPSGGSIARDSGTRDLRLAVLAHWTFVSQGEPLDFADRGGQPERPVAGRAGRGGHDAAAGPGRAVGRSRCRDRRGAERRLRAARP